MCEREREKERKACCSHRGFWRFSSTPSLALSSVSSLLFSFFTLFLSFSDFPLSFSLSVTHSGHPVCVDLFGFGLCHRPRSHHIEREYRQIPLRLAHPKQGFSTLSLSLSFFPLNPSRGKRQTSNSRMRDTRERERGKRGGGNRNIHSDDITDLLADDRRAPHTARPVTT